MTFCKKNCNVGSFDSTLELLKLFNCEGMAEIIYA